MLHSYIAIRPGNKDGEERLPISLSDLPISGIYMHEQPVVSALASGMGGACMGNVATPAKRITLLNGVLYLLRTDFTSVVRAL